MPGFKYPVIDLFFDADGIPCVFLEEISILQPHLIRQFEQKSWEINDRTVLALVDAQAIIEFDKNGQVKQQRN